MMPADEVAELRNAKVALNRQLELEDELDKLKVTNPYLATLIKRQMTFKTKTVGLREDLKYWTRVVAHHKRKRQKELF